MRALHVTLKVVGKNTKGFSAHVRQNAGRPAIFQHVFTTNTGKPGIFSMWLNNRRQHDVLSMCGNLEFASLHALKAP